MSGHEIEDSATELYTQTTSETVSEPPISERTTHGTDLDDGQQPGSLVLASSKLEVHGEDEP
jgi:hypothetical protein